MTGLHYAALQGCQKDCNLEKVKELTMILVNGNADAMQGLPDVHPKNPGFLPLDLFGTDPQLDHTKQLKALHEEAKQAAGFSKMALCRQLNEKQAEIEALKAKLGEA